MENNELDEYDQFVKGLSTKYPEMYRDVYCGISIGKGWFQIVDELSGLIHSHYKWLSQQGKAAGYPQVAQIKEKFGGLRFYIDAADDYTYGAINMAEQVASRTCEVCGAPGTRRSGGWIRTLCDHHEEERQAMYRRHTQDVE